MFWIIKEKLQIIKKKWKVKKNAFKIRSGHFKKLYHDHFRSLFSVATFIQLKTADVLKNQLFGGYFKKLGNQDKTRQ